MSVEKKSLDNQERRKNIIGSLEILIEKYPDYKNDIEDLIFHIEEKQLGNWQALLLRIWESVLRVKRNESEWEMLTKLETFLDELLQDDVSKTQKEVKEKAIDSTSISLVEWKNKTYWRDITPVVIQAKHVFVWEKISDEMSELRQLIHDWTLWKKDYSISYKELKLEINKWDSDEIVLEKLAIFLKKLSTTYKDKFDILSKPDLDWKDFNKDRKKAWAVIFSSFNDFRWKFKWEALGYHISELRDLIDNYMLWRNTWYSINQDWVVLDIQKWANLDTIVEKILVFIENIQTKYPEKFDKKEIIDAKSVIKNKEEEKVYWRDVVAWVDILQKKYTKADYPILEKLKEMMENGKLWHWTSLYFNIGPAILEIEPTDSEKAVKNKVSVFIWILKQISDQEDEKNKLNDTYWRDIEATLKWYEDIYWNNLDYQMLIMLIESWTLWTVKDFKAEIEWVEIKIVPSDSDAMIKQKLVDFINWLKNQKNSFINNKKFTDAKKKIQELEENMVEIDNRYRKAVKSKDQKIDDLERKVHIYEQEIKKLKSAQQSQAIPKSSYSRPSYNG